MNLLFLLRPKDDIVYIRSDADVRRGLNEMKSHGYTAIPVINKADEYVGTVSEGDFLWAISGNGDPEALDNLRISEIIRSKRDKAVTVSAGMDELLLMIMEQNFVPVTDDRGKFIGIVTRRDIIKYFYDKNRKKEKNRYE